DHAAACACSTGVLTGLTSCMSTPSSRPFTGAVASGRRGLPHFAGGLDIASSDREMVSMSRRECGASNGNGPRIVPSRCSSKRRCDTHSTVETTRPGAHHSGIYRLHDVVVLH